MKNGVVAVSKINRHFKSIITTNNYLSFLKVVMNLKPFVYKTGKTLTEIKEYTKKAIKEAQALGLENDEIFIESVLVSILDLEEDEYIQCIRELNKKFVESKYASFDDFMESLLQEDGGMSGGSSGGATVSTSFDLGERPEHLGGASDMTPKKKKKKEDEEEGK